MKNLLIITLLFLSLTVTAYAYPESQMDDCIASALKNPATRTISKNSITNYCDCALNAIIDENKDIRESGYECAKKNFE